MNKMIPHPEFAERMQLACDGNPNVPPPNFGRLGWFAERILNTRGENVTVETVRKWFAGETIPRKEQMSQLAMLLGVDNAWLSLGASNDITEKAKKVRNAVADGTVNVTAGFIAMCGGHPAFPEPGDKRAEKSHVDLYAVIKGAQYAITVVLGVAKADGIHFMVPAQADSIVIGVIRTSDLAVRFVELDAEGIEVEGKRRGAVIDVPLIAGREWRNIETFSERL